MLNQTLEMYREILPHIKEYLKQDIMIGLTDGEKFIGFWQGNKMRAPIQVGDKLKSDDPMIETFHTGKVIDITLPPHIHGFPFRSITAPVRDSKGKIVGTIGIGSSLELMFNVKNIINDIQAKLSENMETIQKFDEVSDKLSQQSQNILKFMNEILEKSKQINGVTQEISNIAMQTQILAINASVEAAHAGTFGKGFAVVAQEMRSLATTSQSSSQKILDLIHGLSEQVTQNYEELKALETSLTNQQESVNQISENTEQSKALVSSVIDVIHQ